MAKSHSSLFGNAPDKFPIALLLIDLINDLDFPENQPLLRQAVHMAKNVARLKRQARRVGCPVVYVNDNFGRWRSDFKNQVEHCLGDDVPGRSMVELLQPEQQDYFVLKPAHSGFFSTTLDLLLEHLGAKALIITGIATNICVLFTANDAFLRGYEVCVPRDCVAANSARLTRESLEQMRTVLKATLCTSRSIPWKRWLHKRRGQSNA